MSDSGEIFNKIPEHGHKEVRPSTDSQAFENIIQARRSVRVYESQPVPEAVMRQALEWALLAPNSSNLQCWEFYWVKHPVTKLSLAKYCFNQPAARTAPELVVAVARPSLWKKHAAQMLKTFAEEEKLTGKEVPKSARAYYSKLAPFVYTQGPLNIIGYLKKVLFFFRGLTQVTPREPTTQAGMRLWAAKSCALACENFMLGMSALGYDTCPMEGFDSKRVKKLLKLSCNDEVVMVISAGKRAPNGVYGKRIRFPSEQFIKEV